MVLPAAVFFFFCRYLKARCRGAVKWLWCAGYVALSAGLSAAEYGLGLKGSPGLVLEVMLLACCGKAFGKKGWMETFAVSVLVLSVLSVADGIVSWAEHRVFMPVIFAHESFIRPGDGVRELLKVLGAMVLFWAVLKHFGGIVEEEDKRLLGWLAVPVFFLAMVERIIRNSVYGDSLVLDSATGRAESMIDINHGEMLLLQVFACFCLFLALFAHERILCIFREAERLKLLNQQAGAWEAYVREAAMRYEQTRAFRHDMKNHLAVLEKLLRDNQAGEAGKYLSQLEEAAKGLSSEISTGNAAVDALLGSKLGLAAQEGIAVEWDIRIPKGSGIMDMDWCIILANGIDNAWKACRDMDEGPRYLNVRGRKKGNFYMVFVENSCRQDMDKAPKDGTGLGSIRATAKKYGGRVENQVLNGRYTLKVLLVDPQQENGI